MTDKPPGPVPADATSADGTSADAPHADNHAPTIARNARYGLWLFGAYVLLYGGFMGLNAFAPQRMGQPALAGVNLAIVYGIALIIAALALAVVYMILCRNPGRDDADAGQTGADAGDSGAGLGGREGTR